MKKLFLMTAFVFLASLTVAQTTKESESKEILKVLEEQRIAWNSGSLEDYMHGYWKSDSLRFVGKSGVRYGWKETLASYKKGYPSQNEMGKLSFDVISLEFLNVNSAYMIGKWIITQQEKEITGHFLLIWKKINGIWLIVADHSS